MGQKMIKNITIYGAGAIGGWLGARLAGVGCSVSVVARGATLAALQQNGLQLVEADGTTTHTVRASSDPAALGVQDLVVIAVKAPACWTWRATSPR
jgi:2-dehydropantoate 2-reductase